MRPGTVIAGRYRIVRLLGRGGMGAVYEAIDEQTKRARAVKLMLEHKVDDAEARGRFEREARIAGGINSSLVVDVLDAGVDIERGMPYLVMELLVGEDLEQRLTRLGPRPASEIVDLLGEVARALTQMHAKRVVHRDLKPSNIFLEQQDGRRPRIKVLDLGLAKVLSETGGATTAIVGSMPYMAPEQIQGRAIGPAVDLYALGLIAFTLLTGVVYWSQAPNEEPIALAMRIACGPQVAASIRAPAIGVDVAAEFDAWFARAVAQRPDERYLSALDTITALAGALRVVPPAWTADELELSTHLEDIEAIDEPPPRALLAGVTETTSRASGKASMVPHRALPTASSALRWSWMHWRVGAPLLAVLVGAAIAAELWCAPPPPSPPDPRPPTPSSWTVACPIFAVEGDVAEWGWLGVAAAAIACERERVMLGGLTSRTEVPAELLDLRRESSTDDDPYGAPEARARSLRAAQGASAYLDGRVFRLGSDDLRLRFRVDLSLRRSDESEIARASGEGDALYSAVRAAMTKLTGPGVPPQAERPDPSIADFARASDIVTLAHLTDLKFAMVNNSARDLAEDCAWFSTPAAEQATDLASFSRYLCSYTFGEPTPDVVLPAPTSLGAKVARARVEHIAFKVNDPEAIRE